MSVQASPGFNLQPSAEQVALSTNYITNFDFLNQYLPDTYEKEFERYGNRSVSSFLRMVGAEMPSNSDLIKWAEQGRLHTKYVNCTTTVITTQDTATFTINDTLSPGTGGIAVRVGQTIMLSPKTIAGTVATVNKAIVTSVNTATGVIEVAFYEANGMTNDNVGNIYEMFIYGSEFKKGTTGMVGSLEADDEIFENSPIILKDKYAVSGSDMAQIGWIEVTTENGASGYYWYMKSEHETRLRFDDYLETAMIEAVPAATGSGAAAVSSASNVGNKGSEGVFYTVGNRGNVWAGANPAALSDWDTIVQRLDKQGSIEENVLFLDRSFGFAIDDMLAGQNSYGTNGTSYGLFDNDKDMALNLGFTGFRRGYDFYKSDWKYLNDPTMRGGLTNGKVNGMLVPAGSTTVYDQILGKNAKRPFLHVRYRASETEDRRYKTWMTGSAGGASNSDLDAMEVNFLSERAVCTLGANNFFLFKQA
tara:strand:+ start:1172 stop:2599 length:1428 start_codon:yes stop_codon:yes gene_type:complete